MKVYIFSYPLWVDRDDDSLLSVDVGDLLDRAVARKLPAPLKQCLLLSCFGLIHSIV